MCLPRRRNTGAIDASSQFFVAVDSTAKTLQSFRITPVGAGPWVVAFDPQDRAVFVADQSAGTITPDVFTYSTGALGAAGTPVTVFANGLTNITVDITGTYLYAGVNAPAAPPNSKGAVAVHSGHWQSRCRRNQRRSINTVQQSPFNVSPQATPTKAPAKFSRGLCFSP
jgi:hypothetical protein